MIKLIVLDVDGCLTDGKIIYSAEGVESKNFNVKDGLGITTWLQLGHYAAIITGRNSTIVQKRASELGVTHLYQGVDNKLDVLKGIAKELSLRPYEIAAIGDDLNDYDMLQYVGKSFTPCDGHKAIAEIADIILTRDGGDGAVREMIDIIVEQNDQYEQFISLWTKE